MADSKIRELLQIESRRLQLEMEMDSLEGFGIIQVLIKL